MDVVFTICSNNYLAHAATLMRSWFLHHPQTTGYVILVDELNEEINYDIVKPAAVLPLSYFGIEELPNLVEKYNITELNTAVKPDVFLFLFKKHPTSKVIYLDPDILVVSKFEEVLDGLNYNDFVLTPHICKPVDDDKSPTDFHTLRTGIFNLGFIALKNSKQIQDFLIWWRHRVLKYGHGHLPINMFYDQLWANYIPVFYEDYLILKHPGYNVANWNLHERYLEQTDLEQWVVNEKFKLRFFHFSGYKFNLPDHIGSYHTRYDFVSRPDLVSIFETYQKHLIDNGVEFISTVPCVYFEEHKRLRHEKEMANQVSMPQVSLKRKMLQRLASFARNVINS
jgi:hypothetical protein